MPSYSTRSGAPLPRLSHQHDTETETNKIKQTMSRMTDLGHYPKSFFLKDIPKGPFRRLISTSLSDLISDISCPGVLHQAACHSDPAPNHRVDGCLPETKHQVLSGQGDQGGNRGYHH